MGTLSGQNLVGNTKWAKWQWANLPVGKTLVGKPSSGQTPSDQNTQWAKHQLGQTPSGKNTRWTKHPVSKPPSVQNTQRTKHPVGKIPNGQITQCAKPNYSYRSFISLLIIYCFSWTPLKGVFKVLMMCALKPLSLRVT